MAINQTDKKYPLTVAGLYATTGSNSRSAVLRQEDADRACAAIQAAVGGKLAVKATRAETKAQKGKSFPDYFLEAVTPDLLAEERERMAAQNGKEYTKATKTQFATIPSYVNNTGDDAL